MHPMCFSIYGLFYYECLLKDAKKRREKRYEDEPEDPLVYDFQKIKLDEKLLSIQDNFKFE